MPWSVTTPDLWRYLEDLDVYWSGGRAFKKAPDSHHDKI